MSSTHWARQAVLATAIVFGFAAAAQAAVTTLTTFTASLAGGTGPMKPSGGVADAQSAFLGELADGSVRIEGFEGANLGEVLPGVGLSIFSMEALLSGSGDIKADPFGPPPDDDTPGEFFGRFNTTEGGKNWWETALSFSIEFKSPISALGFYLTDLGDFDGSLLLLLHGANNDGTIERVTVPRPDQSLENGSLTFFGFIDPNRTFGKIEFSIVQRECEEGEECAEDFLGFDDLIFGALRQTEPPPPPPPPNGAPEPTSLSLLGAALLGLAWTARRRRSR